MTFVKSLETGCLAQSLVAAQVDALDKNSATNFLFIKVNVCVITDVEAWSCRSTNGSDGTDVGRICR